MSVSPRFVSVDDVIRIHHNQIQLYGGTLGLRDMGLLESAVAAASAKFGGQLLHADLFEMAAALMVALVKNHAFIDGNKRVGTAAALFFLAANGLGIENHEPTFSDLVLGVAKGEVQRAEVAEFFRANAKPFRVSE